jgi:prevent-host-death family protein
MKVSISEAKANFPQLVRRAAAGEEIVITKFGKPMAVLVPYESAQKPLRKPGAWKGKIRIKPGFYTADKEIEKLFYGN